MANDAETQPEESVKMPGDDLKHDRAGDNQHTKIVRILTVIAYVCSVSAAAVMLSLYYVFIWDPKPVTPSSLIMDDDEMAYTATTSSPILNASVTNFTESLKVINFILYESIHATNKSYLCHFLLNYLELTAGVPLSNQ